MANMVVRIGCGGNGFSYFSMIRLSRVLNVKKVRLPWFMYSADVRVIGVRIALWKVVRKLVCRS